LYTLSLHDALPISLFNLPLRSHCDSPCPAALRFRSTRAPAHRPLRPPAPLPRSNAPPRAPERPVLDFALTIEQLLQPLARRCTCRYPLHRDAPFRLDAASAATRERLQRSEEHTSELQSPCNLVC